MSSICIIRTSSIGDVVLATVTLNLLHSVQFDGEITWVGREPTGSLLRACFPSLRVVDIGHGTAALSLNKIAELVGPVDLVVDLQGNLRSKLLAIKLRFSGAKVSSSPKEYGQRVKMVMKAKRRGRNALLPEELVSPEFRQTQLMVKALTKGMSAVWPELDLTSVTPRPNLPPVPNDETPSVMKELNQGEWLAVAPGAAFAPKRAPTTVFESILKQFQDRVRSLNEVYPNFMEGGCGLVFLGGKEDQESASELMSAMNWKGPTLNLTGKVDLTKSSQALRYVSGLLTNDSSLGHIAEAVGTPVGVLFGPTVEGFGFVPWKPESMAFSNRIGCRPCSKHGKLECRYQDYKCFYGIDSGAVVDKMIQWFDLKDGSK